MLLILTRRMFFTLLAGTLLSVRYDLAAARDGGNGGGAGGRGGDNGGGNGNGPGSDNGGGNDDGHGSDNGGGNDDGQGSDNGGGNDDGQGSDNGGGNDDGQGNDDGGGDDSEGGGDDDGGGDDGDHDDNGADKGKTKNQDVEWSEDKVLKEREMGRVIPLQAALRIVADKVRGRVIDVDLLARGGKPQYRVKVRRTDGVIKTVRLDARTGRLIGFLGF